MSKAILSVIVCDRCGTPCFSPEQGLMQIYHEIDGQDLCPSCAVVRMKEKESEVKQYAETRARDDDYAEC